MTSDCFDVRRNFIATKVAGGAASGSGAFGDRRGRPPSDESVAGAQVHILLGRCCTFGWFPTAYTAPPWRVDLTSRFLQFGVLENQCGQSYLAVPIASLFSFVQSSLLSSPSRSLRLRNCKTRSDERESTVLHHA